MVKVIVLGLDGADLDIIKKAGDKLPNLYSLLKGGTSAYLNSTIPPITIPAWVSMFTGKNPAKIGTLSFRKVVKTNNGYTSTMAKPTWRGETLWDYLSISGHKVAIVNVPGTYPAWKVNGVMISGFPSPRISTYPPNLADQLPRDCAGERDVANVSKKLELMKQQTEKIIDLILFLAEKEFDLIVCILRITDVFLHHTSKLSELLEAYKHVDRNIDKIINLIGKKYDYLFIVSDHGAKSVKKKFYPNVWLNKEGYLYFKKELPKWEILAGKVANFLASKGLKSVVWTLYYYLQKGKLKSVKSLMTAKDTIDIIDWNKTSAFTFGLSGIDAFELWIIDKNKEDEILNKLRSLVDESGRKVIKNIFKPHELYGKHPNTFPDYIVQLNEGYSCVLGRSNSPFSSATGFIHRRKGIFMAYGMDIKKNYHAGSFEIIDITPTLLHLFEVPIPEDVDGRVIKEIFNENSNIAKRDITYKTEKDEIKSKIHRLISTGKL